MTTAAGGGIREIGYTEEGIVWARLIMEIEGSSYQGVLQMTPEIARQIADNIKTSADMAEKFLIKKAS